MMEPRTRRPGRRHRRLTLYGDGASRGNPGPAGVGVVAHDARGRMVAGVAEYLGETTNNVAEYRALLRALEEARAHGAHEIHVYTDSALVTRQITGAYRVKSPHLSPLHQEATVALQRFRRWSITHSPRQRNAVADALANQAIDAQVAGSA